MKMMSGVAASVLIPALLSLGLTTAAQAQNESEHHFVDAQGRQVTVTSGQPQPDHYGPKPSFAQLDRDHDGTISRDEAEAYPPLLNDFDYLAHGANTISAGQYARWDRR